MVEESDWKKDLSEISIFEMTLQARNSSVENHNQKRIEKSLNILRLTRTTMVTQYPTSRLAALELDGLFTPSDMYARVKRRRIPITLNEGYRLMVYHTGYIKPGRN